jgi:hypothetical protein
MDDPIVPTTNSSMEATGLPAMNRITDVVLVAANAATDVTLSPVAKYVYVLFTL